MLQAPDGTTHQVPSFCRVQVHASPAPGSDISFEVWLPETWNGRYFQHGEGGGGGHINYAALAAFAQQGAVVAATDDGLSREAQGSEPPPSDSRHLFLYRNHPVRFVDNTYRSLEQTSSTANALIRAYYGQAAKYRYFEGCSGGGTYAMRAVQRLPDDWDGVLVGAPANNTTRYFISSAWNAQTWLDPRKRITPDKLRAIQRAALASCQPSAYVQDGIAADPRYCRFDPEQLACKGEETSECLTAPQVDTLRRIYRGPQNPATGEKLYPGFPPTAEAGWAGWITGTTGNQGGTPYAVSSANSFFRYVFNNAEWNVSKFDFDADVAQSEAREISGKPLRQLINATDPDFSRLRAHGGKVLMYFGWADPIVTPLEGISYYDSIVKTAGGLREAQDFFRLFLIPGMGHCGMNGPGANAFGQWPTPALRDDASHNIVRALEAWVETGRQPDDLIAAKFVDDDPKKGVAATRRLCRYPEVPVYTGRGSSKDAASFKCKSPFSS